ncbi:immunity protein Imm33 domain-containing protein [Mycolicibacterium fallax]|uniref:immunity protein Imm33 domain-containing protein n=1 Tax=Mycolicibacterium fallax TaxID=1793 RepID=UPI000A15CDF2|nr:DUF2185 domain-containing protein [Mycolicibacterium fallax]BBY97549.1 hypothetical protein MFAL_10160 [Mycolicibacterium fallax]
MTATNQSIPGAGVCLATVNALQHRGAPLWVWRRPSEGGDDNGWRIMSHLDTVDDLENPDRWHVIGFNEVCVIEPGLAAVWGFPVGTGIQLVRDERGFYIFDTFTGELIPPEQLYPSQGSTVEAVFDEFGTRFQLWRLRYALAERPAWGPPTGKGGKLWVRYGYPGPGWVGFVVSPREGGYDLLRVRAEVPSAPVEKLVGFFVRADDAGKYILFEIGEHLRSLCGLAPLMRLWHAAGVDPRITVTPVARFVRRYEVACDPRQYAILHAGGIQPQARILALSYDELDNLLCAGMPANMRAAAPGAGAAQRGRESQ